MSPEQAMGRPGSARGDLYQAGATLYFALTGLSSSPRYPSGRDAHNIEAPPPGA
jgi:serine/threonine-protein kinase